jgi:chaperonin GroES
MAIGDSKEIQVKKGQKVIYNRYSGTEVNMEGENLLIIKSDDVLAVVGK